MAEKGIQAPNYKDGTAYRCMETAVMNNTKLIESCEMIMDVLATHPELDAALTKAFGIMPQPARPPVK